MTHHPTDGSRTPDLIVSNAASSSTGYDITLIPPSGQGESAPYLATPADELDGVVSPDGKWIAYSSTEN